MAPSMNRLLLLDFQKDNQTAALHSALAIISTTGALGLQSVATGCRTRTPSISWHAVRGTRTILRGQFFRIIRFVKLD